MEQEGKHNGRIYFVQRHTEGELRTYLYFFENAWHVGHTPGGRSAGIRNRQGTCFPPTSGWEYLVKGNWRNDDTTLRLEFSTLSPCRMIRVEGDAEVSAHHSRSMGDYRFQMNRWSSGRPVYKLVNSEVNRYLLVKEGKVN